MFTRLARHVPLIATLVIGASCAAAVAQPQAAVAAPKAPAVTYTHLKLINGWQNAAFGASKAQVADISGIITFKGAIWTNGSSIHPFVLPKSFRPPVVVWVPVDECGANYGNLVIWPTGEVEVDAEGLLTNATCFTSLDGVSFAKSGTSFTTLTLRNGWVKSSGTAKPSARVISGIVHLRGGMKTSGSSDEPLILPKAFRPAAIVFVPVDMCNSAKGHLEIKPSGVVFVETEQAFSNATCFTSLDGVSYALSAKSFTSLALKNGWHSYGAGTAKAAVRLINGVVHFKGAISSGSTNRLFTLAKGFRPAHTVWTPVDLCSANNGRLEIDTNGAVFVQEEGNTFSHATCFTSLDGAWFAR
jgi:hypothetical protein